MNLCTSQTRKSRNSIVWLCTQKLTEFCYSTYGSDKVTTALDIKTNLHGCIHLLFTIYFFFDISFTC